MFFDKNQGYPFRVGFYFMVKDKCKNNESLMFQDFGSLSYCCPFLMKCALFGQRDALWNFYVVHR